MDLWPLISAFVLSFLVVWMVTRALRNRASMFVRVTVGGVVGIFCVFVFSGIAVLWMYTRIIAHHEPPEKFDAAAYKGATAEIALSHDGEGTLSLHGPGDDSKHLDVAASNGVAVVPAGKYSVCGYEMTVENEDKETVRLYARFDGSSPEIDLLPGSTCDFKAGPPLTASVTVKQSQKNRVTMDFHLTGSAGESCSISGARNEAPGFLVLSPTGEVLMQGKFEYG